MARSLALFNPRSGRSAVADGATFAIATIDSRALPSKTWRPVRGARGEWLLFDGLIDNADEAAADLGIRAASDAELYLQAILRWGPDADRRLHGSYSALLFDAKEQVLTATRSPLAAPPLHFWHTPHHLLIATVPRVLFATGELAQQVDLQKLADNLVFNNTEQDRGWYVGTGRVPLGHRFAFRRGQLERVSFHKPHDVPIVRFRRDEEYVEAASELLDKATRASLRGVTCPGVTLSGGLDSAQIAVRVLDHLPAGERLPSFTFVPSSLWGGEDGPGTFGDERPFVDALAAMYPRIEPHYFPNEGIGHEDHLQQMFLAAGSAPSGMVNFYCHHALWSGARSLGCDALLYASFGNHSFSATGEWGRVEYLKRLRLRQLAHALRKRPPDPRGMARKFVAQSVLGLLPDGVWRRVKQVVQGYTPLSRWYSPLSSEATRRYDAVARARAAGQERGRSGYRSRKALIEDAYRNAEGDSAEIYRALEQVHGIAHRDPTYYRPLVEFCFGIPTDQFLRDGESRWLARRLAVGRLPEAQRTNWKTGKNDVDGRERIAARAREYAAELARMKDNKEISRLIDVERLQDLLPLAGRTDGLNEAQWLGLRMALPRALMTSRFLNFVDGRNEL